MERAAPHILWLPGSCLLEPRADYGSAVRRRYAKLGENDLSQSDRDVITNVDPKFAAQELGPNCNRVHRLNKDQL